MTLDQIIGAKASELESWSDEQIEKFFTPFFDVTRPPDNPPKGEGKTAKTSGMSQFDLLLKLADVATAGKKFGVDVKDMIGDLSKVMKK